MIFTYMLLKKFFAGPSPEQTERKRRLAVNAAGKRSPCEIVAFDGKSISYTYSVAGITYGASQDVSEIQVRLPVSEEKILGHGSVKYDPRNAANSIVLCEEWSGLPGRKKARTMVAGSAR